tara:strand:+ start:2039 stop:3142 length:1104 start_codon:yes stop_codon:yes gene_type:complete
MNLEQFAKSKYADRIKSSVKSVESLRNNPDNPIDTTYSSFVKKTWDISMAELFADLGIEPGVDTIQNLVSMPDESVRWLIPEIIREALRLGLRKSPIWSDLIAMEQSIKGTTVTMPHWEMSDATPRYVGIAETIPVGGVNFGQKDVTTRKMGRGIAIPYEITQYVAINIVSIFMQDFGVKLGLGLDNALIQVLINGEQSSGSESAPVIGVEDVPTGIQYMDYLRTWIRMSRIGRRADTIISGEAMGIKTLEMEDFKQRSQGTTNSTVDLKTPYPSRSNYYIHGAMPADQAMVVDSTASVIKLNSQPLKVESDKIVQNQTEEFYASLTTGYAVIYRDARVIIDESLAFAAAGFPTYMDVDAAEQVVFE